MSRLTPAVLVCALAVAGAAGATPGRTIGVADFESAVQTAQGGFFRSVGASPDQVRDSLATVGEPASGAWRVEVTAGAPDADVGGIIPLFDERMEAGAPALLNIGEAPNLCLRLIGDLGERRLRVDVVATRSPDPSEPGVLLRKLDPSELDRSRWREVILAIPSDRQDLARLGAIRLLLDGQGPAWFAVDAVGFVADGGGIPAPTGEPARPHRLRKAMWVWRPEQTLAEPQQIKDLLAVCRRDGFTDLFCQVPYLYENENIRLALVDEQRALNTAAAQAGITVHALDGARHYARRENHSRLFKLVKALDEFNRAGAPESRYRGVHMDNEPYLLDEWKQGGESQQRLIQEYLELNRELGRLTKAAGMQFGVDIPFWWDKVELSGKAVFRVKTENGEIPLLEALFPHVQNVAVMSYRDRVTGHNGVVGTCLTELALGARLGVDVFASVEVGWPRTEKGTSFGGYSREYFLTQLATLERIVSSQAGCAGIAIHAYHYYRDFAEKRP